MSNGSLNLQFVAGAPEPRWSSGNQIVFDATFEGWQVSPTTFAEQGGHGVRATNEQVLSVLGNLTALRFAAQYIEAGITKGSVALDSVQRVSPMPEPQTAWLLVAGLAALAARKRRP